jgi:outer membrane protein OmpA-like peptidoglycan-associated protein
MGTEFAKLVRAPAKPATLAKKQAVRESTAQQISRASRESAAPAGAVVFKSFLNGPPRAPSETKSGLRIPLQRKLAIGKVNDPLESEADAIADRVMRAQVAPRAAYSSSPTLRRKCSCEGSGQSCPACEQEKKENTTKDQVPRKAVGAVTSTEAPAIVHEVLSSAGQPLDPAGRSFMELRFGHDFSKVRVHIDNRADDSALEVNAVAYTVGNHIIFRAGQYNPSTAKGRHLLAHELAHTVQQQSSPTLRRTLAVDGNQPVEAPAGDPAASLTPAQRFSMMNPLIQGLCPQFKVDSTNGQVVSTTAQTLVRASLASGSKSGGCCCLSILTDASTPWTIEVSGFIGAQTDFAGHKVFITPTDAPLEFGAFTGSNKLAFQGIVPNIGHELCGHAALEEIGAHPPNADRLRTNVHDPTVNIENVISTEQGVPGSDLRGLAASGSHRGESVDKITIKNYPFNVSDIPAGEQPKIKFAAKYIHTPGVPTSTSQDEFVSILGHSDKVGSSQANQFVSDERAKKVRDALVTEGVPPTITSFGLTTARFTKVAGVSDTQPPPPPLDANQANWRRVDILVNSFPAGAQNIPSGTPTGVAPAPVNPNVSGLKSSSDPCISKLVNAAYP